MIIIWIIVSIILFSIIVLVHEWWHFAAARKFWVKVEEFWLGIPPRAKKLFRDKKWTLFTLNWLPIWGFVKLYWENPALLKNKDDKNALSNKKSRQQAIIILAWVFMNFLLAIIIFSILFFIWIKPLWINTKIETDLKLQVIPTYNQALESGLLIKKPWLILSPVEWSIAEKAGIKAWDILISINWEENISQKEMIEIVSKNSWKEITITRDRNNECKDATENCIFEEYEKEIKIRVWDNWKIWTYIWENIEINKDYIIKYSFLNSIKYWTLETYNQALLTFKWLGILIKKIFNPETKQERQEAIDSVSWPIWIVDFISNSISAWIIFIIVIWAIISINLWVFNLLPIPALDWWRFLFITINGIIQRIFWKKVINENIEWIIHVWFFVFLIILSILIAYNDIIKIMLR